MATQWRYSFAGPTGLDYAAVIDYIKLQRFKSPRKLFEKVRLIEHGALDELTRAEGEPDPDAED